MRIFKCPWCKGESELHVGRCARCDVCGVECCILWMGGRSAGKLNVIPTDRCDRCYPRMKYLDREW